MSSYYKLPIRLNRIIKKQEHDKCTFEESIRQNIYMIITTYFGEYRYDNTYGCSIWERDLEILKEDSAWKNEAQQSIRDSLIIHEKRLSDIDVKVDIQLSTFIGKFDKDVKRTKKKIEITVEAKILSTNEPIIHLEVVHFSPISLDESFDV
ncbi:MAG: GPW/gp25 family protein [Chitinophagales bacterium]